VRQTEKAYITGIKHMDLDGSKSASKCAKTDVRAFEISKIFPGVIPPDPRFGGRDPREGRGGKEGWEERGM
jgi:hypothetical protein